MSFNCEEKRGCEQEDGASDACFEGGEEMMERNIEKVNPCCGCHLFFFFSFHVLNVYKCTHLS